MVTNIRQITMARLGRERGEGVLKASTILIVALLTLADTAESFRYSSH